MSHNANIDTNQATQSNKQQQKNHLHQIDLRDQVNDLEKQIKTPDLNYRQFHQNFDKDQQANSNQNQLNQKQDLQILDQLSNNDYSVDQNKQQQNAIQKQDKKLFDDDSDETENQNLCQNQTNKNENEFNQLDPMNITPNTFNKLNSVEFFDQNLLENQPQQKKKPLFDDSDNDLETNNEETITQQNVQRSSHAKQQNTTTSVASSDKEQTDNLDESEYVPTIPNRQLFDDYQDNLTLSYEQNKNHNRQNQETQLPDKQSQQEHQSQSNHFTQDTQDVAANPSDQSQNQQQSFNKQQHAKNDIQLDNQTSQFWQNKSKMADIDKQSYLYDEKTPVIPFEDVNLTEQLIIRKNMQETKEQSESADDNESDYIPNKQEQPLFDDSDSTSENNDQSTDQQQIIQQNTQIQQQQIVSPKLIENESSKSDNDDQLAYIPGKQYQKNKLFDDQPGEKVSHLLEEFKQTQIQQQTTVKNQTVQQEVQNMDPNEDSDFESEYVPNQSKQRQLFDDDISVKEEQLIHQNSPEINNQVKLSKFDNQSTSQIQKDILIQEKVSDNSIEQINEQGLKQQVEDSELDSRSNFNKLAQSLIPIQASSDVIESDFGNQNKMDNILAQSMIEGLPSNPQIPRNSILYRSSLRSGGSSRLSNKSSIQKFGWQKQQAQNAINRKIQQQKENQSNLNNQIQLEKSVQMQDNTEQNQQIKEQFNQDNPKASDMGFNEDVAQTNENNVQDGFEFDDKSEKYNRMDSFAFESEDNRQSLSSDFRGIDDNQKTLPRGSISGFSVQDNQYVQRASVINQNNNLIGDGHVKPYERQWTDQQPSSSSIFSKVFKRSAGTDEINKKWQLITFQKMDEIFRINNMDQIPEWFNDFMKEIQSNQKKQNQNATEFQNSFKKLVKGFSSKDFKKGGQEIYEPVQHKGTIQRYMNSVQFQMLVMLRKHLGTKTHPISIICRAFQDHFGSSYEKYVRPKRNQAGVYDKVDAIQKFRDRTQELKQQFSTDFVGSANQDQEDDEGPKIEDINLTNQIIGEVQGFILVMRWLVYEFYNFKVLKFKGYLTSKDFQAIEEDILFLIHKLIVTNEVFDSLLVLTRLLNNQNDKNLRHKLKQLESKQKPLFPIEQGRKLHLDHSDNGDVDSMRMESNPIFDEIVQVSQKYSATPFEKAIQQFQAIMKSQQYSPLQKLYKLQTLDVMDFFERYNQDFKGIAKGKNIVLTADENIFINVFVMIQAKVPDLVSQVELITAFASEYMQESPDGCEISQAYLSLYSCLQYLLDLDIDEKGALDGRTSSIQIMKKYQQFHKGDGFDDSQSVCGVGLNKLLIDTARVQKQSERRLQSMSKGAEHATRKKSKIVGDLTLKNKGSQNKQIQPIQLSKQNTFKERSMSYQNGGATLMNSMISDVDAQTEMSFDIFALNNSQAPQRRFSNDFIFVSNKADISNQDIEEWQIMEIPTDINESSSNRSSVLNKPKKKKKKMTAVASKKNKTEIRADGGNDSIKSNKKSNFKPKDKHMIVDELRRKFSKDLQYDQEWQLLYAPDEGRDSLKRLSMADNFDKPRLKSFVTSFMSNKSNSKAINVSHQQIVDKKSDKQKALIAELKKKQEKDNKPVSIQKRQQMSIIEELKKKQLNQDKHQPDSKQNPTTTNDQKQMTVEELRKKFEYNKAKTQIKQMKSNQNQDFDERNQTQAQVGKEKSNSNIFSQNEPKENIEKVSQIAQNNKNIQETKAQNSGLGKTENRKQQKKPQKDQKLHGRGRKERTYSVNQVDGENVEQMFLVANELAPWKFQTIESDDQLYGLNVDIEQPDSNFQIKFNSNV